MNAGIVAEAAGLFAVTNVDDIVVLSLFFGRSAGQHGAATRINQKPRTARTAVVQCRDLARITASGLSRT